MNKTFCHKRIEISVGRQNYDVHLKEFNAKFFVTGSVCHEVIPSVNVAKCSELSVNDKQVYQDAIVAIVRIVCPCGDWVEIAKIKQEYGLL